MIIVTGSVLVRDEHIERALEISLEHVRRSGGEPGCLRHSVHRDVEHPCRLVFVEHWADIDTLRTHFAVAESGAFVRELAALGDDPPEMTIFDAQPLSP